ncbi:hypothetical protein CANARDRAFT_174820 [[Candida] arabinofermentans NRRL YB-2248]|uniref:Letm1 RBD domain-containing protein n=1 Tax=[Candida] arabinofermentans NRRL YB-2248 TaxID=983967 RepID=A0A1E4T4V0_9ASCO|nr:hypothetical protein CANARDRAFT_174820 [[Candida] arabinofermentans NRRL YB-2248]
MLGYSRTLLRLRLARLLPSVSASTASVPSNGSNNLPDSPPPKSIWQKVKHEAQHYWDGTKLLGLEIRISSKLLIKMASGYELTRREYRQLQRTINDVLRIFPFAMFVLIPFAELLLPFALKLFPNLLPSTYQSQKEKENKMKVLRLTRTKVSEVLMTQKKAIKLPSTTTDEQRADFKNLYAKLRSKTASEEIDKDQLLRVAKMFKDDIILDNVSRSILVAMGRYLNLKPFGTDQILRYRIRHKMLKIKKDDKLIDYEGVDSLSVSELQVACSQRGIKIYSATPDQMRKWLKNWLDMRLREKIPSTLMILVNAYTYGDNEVYHSQYDALKAVLSSLPEEFYHEQELHVDEDNATFKQRMNVVKEQEQLIKSENVQEKNHVVLVKDKLSLDDDPDETPEVTKEEEEKKKVNEKA